VEEGGRKRFVLAPRRAYGDRDEARILTLPRHLFQDDADLQPGARMAARMSDGDLHPLTVREVKDHRVVVDLNHPLAGQALHFDVVVHEVRPAGPAELFTGKPHEIERV
jgi:FKBP-type peptidyl-prolyl cis-trans isomerase SlyD